MIPSLDVRQIRSCSEFYGNIYESCIFHSQDWGCRRKECKGICNSRLIEHRQTSTDKWGEIDAKYPCTHNIRFKEVADLIDQHNQGEISDSNRKLGPSEIADLISEENKREG